VKLTHPDTGQVIDVADGHDEPYRSQGWVDVAAPARRGKKAATEDSAGSPPADQ
jgi:hypothetical protein